MREQSFEQTENERPHFQKHDASGPQHQEADASAPPKVLCHASDRACTDEVETGAPHAG